MKIETKDRLKQLAEHFNIEQVDMCNKTGIPKSTMSCYFSGKRQPKQNILSQIANTYNVSEAWLMGYDVPMEKTTAVPSFEPDHIKLISLYSKLTEEQKKTVMNLLESMVN